MPPQGTRVDRTIDDLDFDETSLPGPLRLLVPFYRRFAVADDGERERLIEAAAPADLEQLVQAAMEAQIELRNRSL